MDPEVAHRFAFDLIRAVGASPLRSVIAAQTAPSDSAAVQAMGIEFPSRFGLAAGFDKDAAAARGLAMLGFRLVEVGTITPHPQPGNDKPRLWLRIAQRA